MVRKIVVATDLAEDSERALAWILTNVCKPGDEFHIVHVAKLKARFKADQDCLTFSHNTHLELNIR
jgi:hypothetical protein